MPPSSRWFFCTEEDVLARLDATASDVNRVVATFRDDFSACDGRPQVIATGPDDGIDDSMYNATGFPWATVRRIVLREVTKLHRERSSGSMDGA